MTNKTQESRAWRAEQRRLGFTPKLIWVQAKDWPRIQGLIQMLNKKFKEGKK